MQSPSMKLPGPGGRHPVVAASTPRAAPDQEVDEIVLLAKPTDDLPSVVRPEGSHHEELGGLLLDYQAFEEGAEVSPSFLTVMMTPRSRDLQAQPLVMMFSYPFHFNPSDP